MRALALVLILALGTACATQNATDQAARGDARATTRTCATLTTDIDGTEVCTNAIEKTVIGGQGGDKLYETIGIFIGILSIAANLW